VPSNAGTPLESDDDLPQSDRAVTSSPEPSEHATERASSLVPTERATSPTASVMEAALRLPSPTVTDYEEASPHRLITYTARSKALVHARRAAEAQAQREAEVTAKKKPRKQWPARSRRSGRLRAGRIGDSSPPLGLELSQAMALHTMLIAPMPE
jgi:hypothetical protein